MKMQFSILICTYNRSEVLQETLNSLHGALEGMEGIEVIVVDNASSDKTGEVVEDFPWVRYIYEAEVGLSAARNTAVRCAHSERIVFIDDDVVVGVKWVKAYLDYFATMSSEVAFWGGEVDPYFEEPLPEEYANRMKYVSRAWSLVENIAGAVEISRSNCELPIGANFGGRRELFLKVPFDPALGRKGEALTSGEEIAVLRQLIRLGYTGAWVPGAKLLHRVPRERISHDYLKRYFFDYGRSVQRMKGGHSLIQLIYRYGKYSGKVAWSRLTDSHYYFSREFVKRHYYRGYLAEKLKSPSG